MELTEIFAGQSVRHVRDDVHGVVESVVALDEPAPPHAMVRDDRNHLHMLPINQLVIDERVAAIENERARVAAFERSDREAALGASG